MRVFIVAAILTVASGSGVAGAPLRPEAVIDAFHSALARGDTAGAAVLLADDALIFEEGGAERTKAEYTARHLPADAQFSKAVKATVTRRTSRFEGALAWVASEGRVRGIFKGKPVDRRTTETVVLRKGGQSWRIVHIHWSSAAAK